MRKNAVNAIARKNNSRCRGFTLTEILAVMAILSLIMVSLFTIFRQGTETWQLSSARTEAYIKARQILDMISREIRGAVQITAARGPQASKATSGSLTKRADFVGLNWLQLQEWRNNEQAFSDQVYFVAPVANSGGQELCMVGYWVKDVENDTKRPIGMGAPRDSKDDTLQRSYRTDSGGNPDDVWKTFNFSDTSFSSLGWESTGGEVASSVRRLEIRYYYYDDLGILKDVPTWDSLPSAKGGGTATKDDDNRLPAAVRITITVGDKDDAIQGIRLSTLVFLENADRE
jgi:prepilin-type N-terminal cleavage/methylation domain-containing protein